MTELKMKDLEECFNEAIKGKGEYVAVLIQMEGYEKPEIIINTKENFETKLAYYKKAYNDDLTLKTFNGIKIIGFDWDWEIEVLVYHLIKNYNRQ